jgi:lipopolysaccharide transport system permease protein
MMKESNSTEVDMVEHGKAGGQDVAVTVIIPPKGWQLIDFKELREYRDLFYFLVWRDIKVMYAQTVLGFGWAILEPLIQIALFTLIFGKVAKVPTDGVPYLLFSTAAIIPWTYMSSAMTQSAQSMVNDQGMLGKIYFPRLLFPITPILTKLVDFLISMLILVVVSIYYQITPTWNLLYLPLFVLMMMAVPLAGGFWLSSLSVRFRDVKFAMQFVVRTLMFSAPIVYSASSIPEAYRIWYSFNPLVGVIEGFRAALIGGSMPWEYIFPGMLTCVILLVSGAFYFRRMERVVVDVL